MGFRNPFRFTVDPETGWVLMGDYGPDASTTNANRGPQGSVEYNVLTQSGNYGWPYCIRDNVAYNDYNFATCTAGAKFNCAAPVNDSPNNTGRTNLPPALGASAWMGYSETDSRFTDLGTGGAPMGGPRYHFDPTLQSSRKFPAFYDDKWFIGEWNNGTIKTVDPRRHRRHDRRPELRARHRLPAPHGPRLRSRRRALRDRVGLRLQRQQRRLRRLPDRLPQG